MDQSPNLELPYILPSQAQKHVTHNEALQILDVVVQPSIKSTELTTPPEQSERGDRYIISDPATGDWSGKEGQIAAYQDGGWIYVQPASGWLVHDETSGSLLRFADGGWAGIEQTIANAISTLQNLTMLGVGTTADETNKIAVASNASLFTHAGNDHRLSLNKAGENDTASIILQSDYSGHAEIGLTGSNDLSIKVSSDGQTFINAIDINGANGRVSFPEGISNLTLSEFGADPIATTNYITSRGADLITNSTGLLGNNYNFPGFVFDSEISPNLPASFAYVGYGGAVRQSTEFVPVNPNAIYQMKGCIREEDHNHRQYIGLAPYDADQNSISAKNHMRYRHDGVDSYTTLTAPLTPGDTEISVADASGWNESNTAYYQRGIIIFEYENSHGYKYDFYSRLIEFDLFDLAGMNKSTNTITLKKPLPASMGNPGDANGTWPVGTRLANCNSGGSYKYTLANSYRVPILDTWYQLTNHIGGIDVSGTNISNNFPPGTAFTKLLFLPSYSNRTGGLGNDPDSGTNHRVWYGGISVVPEISAKLISNPIGSKTIKLQRINAAGTAIEVVNSGLVEEAL